MPNLIISGTINPRAGAREHRERIRKDTVDYDLLINYTFSRFRKPREIQYRRWTLEVSLAADFRRLREERVIKERDVIYPGDDKVFDRRRVFTVTSYRWSQQSSDKVSPGISIAMMDSISIKIAR